MTTPRRTPTLRALAERAALHPSMEQAVAGAVISAVRNTLPGVIESILAERADEDFGRLTLYRRKVPDGHRKVRDSRVMALLAGGTAPELVALEVGCSRAHVYRVRKAMRAYAGASSQLVP